MAQAATGAGWAQVPPFHSVPLIRFSICAPSFTLIWRQCCKCGWRQRGNAPCSGRSYASSRNRASGQTACNHKIFISTGGPQSSNPFREVKPGQVFWTGHVQLYEDIVGPMAAPELPGLCFAEIRAELPNDGYTALREHLEESRASTNTDIRLRKPAGQTKCRTCVKAAKPGLC